MTYVFVKSGGNSGKGGIRSGESVAFPAFSGLPIFVVFPERDALFVVWGPGKDFMVGESLVGTTSTTRDFIVVNLNELVVGVVDEGLVLLLIRVEVGVSGGVVVVAVVVVGRGGVVSFVFPDFELVPVALAEDEEVVEEIETPTRLSLVAKDVGFLVPGRDLDKALLSLPSSATTTESLRTRLKLDKGTMSKDMS